MPELVEVEIIARNLRKWLRAGEVYQVDVYRPESVHPPGEALLREALLGSGEFLVHRRGKALLLEKGGRWGVLIRFGMSGKIVREVASGERTKARIRLHIRGSGINYPMTLVYLDARNLGHLTPIDLHAHGGAEGALTSAVPGEDALLDPPDPAQVMALLGRSRTPVRARLMDQSRLSGLGNILVTEILFEAGIYPGTPSRDITPQEGRAIAEAIPRVIRRILIMEESEEVTYIGERGAVNPFPVYGRKGQPCPRCALPLRHETIGGRTSVYCPACQPIKG